MSLKKIVYPLSLLLLGLFMLQNIAFAETVKLSSSEPTVLKERQKFNKLRHTTQNIYKVTMRSTVAFKLQTALGFVSTIDLPEPALKVFVGDQELFKVEVYENQVLVKPITDYSDARTNLVVFTEKGRIVFDVFVGDQKTADFVLDFRFPVDDESLVKNAFEKRVEEKTKELEESYKKKTEELEKRVEDLSNQKLKEKVASGLQNIKLSVTEASQRMQVNLLSLSRVGDKVYLRFSVTNHSTDPYSVLKAIIGTVTYGSRSALRKKQVGFQEIPSEMQLAEVIEAKTTESGVLVFKYQLLSSHEKPVFKLLEKNSAGKPAEPLRHLEISGFRWFK